MSPSSLTVYVSLFLPQIADFGLSRDLVEADYYRSRGGKVPVKWTAPEALHYHKYTTSSDVWSYGMVLFEIWSLGHKPFEDMPVSQVSSLKRDSCTIMGIHVTVCPDVVEAPGYSLSVSSDVSISHSTLDCNI